MLSKMKLGARLGLAFGTTAVLLLLTGAVGLFLMSRLQDNTRDLATNWLPSVQKLGELRANVNEARRAALRHVLETTEAGKSTQAAILAETMDKRIPAALSAYEALISSEEERALAGQIKSGLVAMRQMNERLIGLSNQGDASLADTRELAVGESARQFRSIMDVINKDVELNVAGANKSWEGAQDAYVTTTRIVIAGMTLVTVICIVLAWRITRSITEPLSEITDCP